MISTMTLPLSRYVGETKAIEMLAQAGFEAIDYSMHLYGVEDSVYQKPLSEMLENYEKLKKELHRNRMVACQFHTLYPTYTCDAETDEMRFQATVRGIYAAQALGSPYVVVHPMLPSATATDMRREECWALNYRFYSRLIPYLEKCGVQLGIENMYSYDSGQYIRNAMSTAEDMVRYIDRMNAVAGAQRFVACLDTGHAHLLGMNPAQMIEELGSHLHLLHLHDNRQEDDTHTLPFLGGVDFMGLIDALRDTGYQGHISLEAHGFLSRFPLALAPDALQLMAKVARYLEKSLQRT